MRNQGKGKIGVEHFAIGRPGPWRRHPPNPHRCTHPPPTDPTTTAHFSLSSRLCAPQEVDAEKDELVRKVLELQNTLDGKREAARGCRAYGLRRGCAAEAGSAVWSGLDQPRGSRLCGAVGRLEPSSNPTPEAALTLYGRYRLTCLVDPSSRALAAGG